MDDMRADMATLAGGCFWCLEAVFQQLSGVGAVVSGYSGGTVKNPGYREVCTGTTGHAESIQITYDPDVISYRDILEIFFAFHDPTTLNRQGPDAGTQYRSAIFYRTPEEKKIAEAVIAELDAENIWKHPIVTEVTPFTAFYPAEGYHQDYYRRNQDAPYCQVMIEPKLEKLREKYLARLKRPVDQGAAP
jgi:peptide-methionine (S)-S-oxide reductase